MFVTSLVYVLFASDQEQPWGRGQSRKDLPASLPPADCSVNTDSAACNVEEQEIAGTESQSWYVLYLAIFIFLGREQMDSMNFNNRKM